MIINTITTMIINDNHCYNDYDYDKFCYFYTYHHPLQKNRKIRTSLLYVLSLYT